MPLGQMKDANGAERHFIKKPLQSAAVNQPSTPPPVVAAKKKKAGLRRRGKGRAKVADGLKPPDQAAGEVVPAEMAGPPVSTKGITFHRRPGFGQVGVKCVVKANYFLAQLPDKDLNQYDVSKFYVFVGSKIEF